VFVRVYPWPVFVRVYPWPVFVRIYSSPVVVGGLGRHRGRERSVAGLGSHGRSTGVSRARSRGVAGSMPDIGKAKIHPPLSRSIAERLSDGERAFEALGRAIQVVRVEQHVAERTQCVRLQLRLSDLAAQRQALGKHRSCLVGPTQLRETRSKAVQHDHFVCPAVLAAKEREDCFIVPQRMRIPAALPLQDAEHVAERRLPDAIADSRGERERGLKRRDRHIRTFGT
jgi:hypothetical protein